MLTRNVQNYRERNDLNCSKKNNSAVSKVNIKVNHSSRVWLHDEQLCCQTDVVWIIFSVFKFTWWDENWRAAAREHREKQVLQTSVSVFTGAKPCVFSIKTGFYSLADRGPEMRTFLRAALHGTPDLYCSLTRRSLVFHPSNCISTWFDNLTIW